MFYIEGVIVASELKDPIWHSLEWQIGSFGSEATLCWLYTLCTYASVMVNVDVFSPFLSVCVCHQLADGSNVGLSDLLISNV